MTIEGYLRLDSYHKHSGYSRHVELVFSSCLDPNIYLVASLRSSSTQSAFADPRVTQVLGMVDYQT